MDEKTIARFWKKVERRGPEECWPYVGHINNWGYGVISTGPRATRIRLLTHRISYELHKGPIPSGLIVMHSCDNPLCVNPNHLSVGTSADNSLDMKQKGRAGISGLRGESVGNHKLTEWQVRAIRERRATGELLRTIATDFGVSHVLVGLIARRKAWRHVS